MNYTNQIISRVEDIVSSAKYDTKSGMIENHLLLISKPNKSYYMKSGPQYGLFNETHQLIYHFTKSKKLFSYIYEDEERVSHMKWPLCSAIFPKSVTYRDFLVSILDRFWTTDYEFLLTGTTSSLEKHLINMFRELKIDAVLLDGTTDLSITKIGKDREGFREFLNLLNERLKVAVILLANKKDRDSIDFESYAHSEDDAVKLVDSKCNINVVL